MVIEENKIVFTHQHETFLLPGLYSWDRSEFINQSRNSVFLSRSNYNKVLELFRKSHKLEFEVK